MRDMTKYLASLAAALMLVLTTACGGGSKIKLHGTVEGKPTQNMRLVYYNGDALQNVITGVRDGEFGIALGADSPVLVEIYDNDYHLMGRFYAAPGDEIEATLKPGQPYLAAYRGNDVSERYTAVCTPVAETLMRGGPEADRFIADYAAKHRDDIVSAILLTTSYDASRNPGQAAKLMDMLAPEAKPANLTAHYLTLLETVTPPARLDPVTPMTLRDLDDSLVTYRPAQSGRTLIVVSDAASGRLDSIVPVLRRLRRDHSASKLTILDFGTDAEQTSWRTHTLTDSVRDGWIQVWGPGRLAAPALQRLHIGTLPYFIVADSAGRQLYRGGSVSLAAAAVTADAPKPAHKP